MLLRNGTERTRPFINMGIRRPNVLTAILSAMEKNKQNTFAAQVFIDGIDGNLVDVFVHGYLGNFVVSHFASSDVSSVSGWARARHSVIGRAKDLHCARVSGMETTVVCTAQRFKDALICKVKVRIRKTLELSKDFPGAECNPIGVISARETMVLKRAVNAPLVINTSIAENCGSCNDRFVGELKEQDDVISSAKATISRGLAESGDENAHKGAAAHCVPAE